MDMGDNTKDIAENRTYVLELEKRLANVESGLQNISRGFQSGNLAPEQEVRVATVEERLENVEDLQMVANLDLIKINEFIEKIPAVEKQPTFFAGTNAPDLERRVNDEFSRKKIAELEDSLNNLGRKIDSVESSKFSGKSAAGAGMGANDEIRRLKGDFESFKRDTEESVKIIVSSIKKLAERMNR